MAAGVSANSAVPSRGNQNTITGGRSVGAAQSLMPAEQRTEQKGYSLKRSPPLKTAYTFTSTNRELEREKDDGAMINMRGGKRRRRLADSWREINGRDDWVGMLDPLDPLLQEELIRYGEMAQSCYDAFDNDPFSKYSGGCKYHPDDFFTLLGIGESARYEVTRYLYATINVQLPNFFRKSPRDDSWTANANWMGYVAVSDDETTRRIGRRDIAVAWRGTATRLDWVADLMNYLVPVSSEGLPSPDRDVKVQSGFINLYTDKVRQEEKKFCTHSARERILAEVYRLAEMYKDEEISITLTGHSLGGALAVLSAYDIAEMGINVATGRRIPICVFPFSGPRVGNSRFKERMEELGVKVLRVVNVRDMVPKVPGVLVNEHVPKFIRRFVEWLPWCYSHVGSVLELDHEDSPYLKDTIDISDFHNMEAHLHLLDGYPGKGQSFSHICKRDPALVNKSSDFLKDHHLVPPYWRQDENKGLERDEKGKWVQPERPMYDEHVPDIHHCLEQINLKAKVGQILQAKKESFADFDQSL
ncbi:hypothetical protein H6P81_004602 [Aristolochia fimbriata]|uniref:Fungal lipase-type domain-containing protein n=1 Tax=Aristolochia fimbriata TaxID=158543 RepID=A0AAV7EWN2_ARIFI|nr:hypothetical protein H6P81_004602 [Aristolochia fimbriata]